MTKEPLDQFQAMDLLCRKWLTGEGPVHGIDCLDENINIYMYAPDEKVEKKILSDAGGHKVKFHYGPRPKATDVVGG